MRSIPLLVIPNNKGTLLKELVERHNMKYLGPDFPTLVKRNGRPDAISGTKWAHFNITIKPGELTSSDHIPLYIKISTRAIPKETVNKFNYKKANWDKYKRIIESNTTLNDMNNKSKDKIDSEVNEWMENITKAAEESISKNKITYNIHPTNSDYLKILINEYKQLMTIPHWNREKLNTIHIIQNQIKEESVRLYEEKWSQKIKETQEKYRDPKVFWAQVRKMMGTNKVDTLYIVNNAGEKLYTNVEKETEFRNIWQNVFRISPQENTLFDHQHEVRVTNFVNTYDYQIDIFEKSDLDRLDLNNYLTKPITNDDIKQIIKDFKHRAPGKSGINKIMLINIPEIEITKYKDILNATLSMGYFPIILKNGIIILIPKPGKDAKPPINYHPITLLELPSKILERIVNNRFQRFCEEN